MASVSLSISYQDETADPISKDANGSTNAGSLHSKKTSKSKSSIAALQRRKEAEERAKKAVKEKEQKACHVYELWSQAKQEEKTEYYNYLKERVTLQHELIKQQDELFRKRQEKLEEKQNQIKEAKRLARLARSTEYAEFVRDAVATDKLSASKLKSHARVISSHQPQTQQPLPIHAETRKPSRDQIYSSSKKKEDRILGDKWELQTKDFAELLYLPLDAQLNVLLGSTADSFLKPTFREGAKKTLDPVILKQGDGGIGAKELWSVLRHRSWKKLEQQDARISQDVKNAYTSFMRQCLQRNVQPVIRSFCSSTNDVLPSDDNVSESHLLEDVYFTRHRLDLMFRIAHVNRDKTRLLFRDLDALDVEGARMIPVDSQRSRLKDSLQLSKVVEEREDEEAETENEVEAHTIPTSRYNISPTRINEADSEDSQQLETEQALPAKSAKVGMEKIVFLTEHMARCQGEFSKRHKAPGTNVAGDTTRARTSILRPNMNSKLSLSAPVATASMRAEQKNKITRWEPLSLNALQDYKKSYDAPGSGTFRNGQITKWSVLR